MRTTLGMAQILVEGGQPKANLNRAVNKIQEAANRGCSFVVLPECLDLGWTHPSALTMAQPVPGPNFEILQGAASENSIHVVAGLVEKAEGAIFNSAVMIGPDGSLLSHHRKINELSIAHYLYAVGDRLSVSRTDHGNVGINICADNFGSSLAIAHVQARMGARLILSPCAWAVGADHDYASIGYGQLWRDSYSELSKLYDVTVVGVSNVGWLTAGPWEGRKCIGCSLAVGPGGVVLAEGPYGEDAESLITFDVDIPEAPAIGTDVAPMLKSRGYHGP